MSIQFGAQPMYFGPVGVNLTAALVALAVLIIAVYAKITGRKTKLFEVFLMLLLVSLAYQTLHGRLLQPVFPISLPEKPLIDNGLTLNYFATNALTYTVLPLLAILALDRKISAENLCLRIGNSKTIAMYTSAGAAFACSIFLLTDYFFHQQWVSGFTADGLVLWLSLVSGVSAFWQTFFYYGVIFHRNLGKENTALLGVIVFFAFQSYVYSNALPWIMSNIVVFASRLVVTWKTRNIYGATIMAIAVGLVEIATQLI